MSVRQDELEPSVWASGVSDDGEVKHGYPPPRLSVGSITTSYCGEPMIVEGTHSDAPPKDTCPRCVEVWEALHGRP